LKGAAVKIVTWNCNGALRKKYETLEEFDADILVVQECEDPEQSTEVYADWAGDYLWTGKNKNKGIGVFPRKGVTLEKLDWPDDDLQRFLPCRVNDSFNLLAVWTMQADSPTFQYIGQFWKYLQLNKERLSDPNSVICGDFNSNVFWDKWDRWWNHSDVVKELQELDIHSMYHKVMDEEQGQETRPTLFLQRKREKPYHIDYAFVSKAMMNSGNLEVGQPDQWLEVSDHMPIVFDVGGE
jgi:exonuclease III